VFSFFGKNTKVEYTDCFFCDLKPTKEQSFQFQYSADGSIFTVDMCPICAGTLEEIMKKRDGNKEPVYE